jgi:hypothetical protein
MLRLRVTGCLVLTQPWKEIGKWAEPERVMSQIPMWLARQVQGQLAEGWLGLQHQKLHFSSVSSQDPDKPHRKEDTTPGTRPRDLKPLNWVPMGTGLEGPTK